MSAGGVLFDPFYHRKESTIGKGEHKGEPQVALVVLAGVIWTLEPQLGSLGGTC